MASPDELLDHATDVPFQGWDFTVLGDRIVHEPPPWSLATLVEDTLDGDETMLDMGTGGGEWLSSVRRPARVVATEGWAQNVPVAAARLRPLGVSVLRDEGAIDNVDQDTHEPRGRLAFGGGVFDLVTNRHEAFVADEVSRVLGPGGIFLTQQTESGRQEFHHLLGLEAPLRQEFSLELAIDQVTAAGLSVERSEAGIATTVFADIGALAWYFTNVPWVVPGFSIATHRDRLLALPEGPLPVSSTRFLLVARKP